MLHVSNLRKRYGDLEVVRNLSFDVPSGQCYGLLGPNGAGKTTTLRCCLGHTKPDAGTIRLAGLPVPDRAREARVRVGVVPQFDTHTLDPDFTVTENLVVFGRYFGLSKRECLARVPKLLDFAGLADKANAHIEALSGGMKRRLTLARAMINDPQVLFLDEPTTGLDPQARHLVWDRLKALLNEGRTIILTTHFMDEAQRLCDRVAIVDHGRLIALGTLRELVQQIGEEDRITLQIAQPTLPPQLLDQLHAAFPAPVRLDIQHDAEQNSTILQMFAKQGRKQLPQLLQLLNDAELEVHSIELREPDLEAVFLALTGRQLRD